MISKEQVHTFCIATINSKINFLNESLAELKDAMEKDTKSSAGDKHETSRAMVQIEQEKLMHQLHEFEMQKDQLLKIDISSAHEFIRNGSLIQTDSVLFFIGVALGKLIMNDVIIMAISGQSPLGQIFMTSKQGDTVSFNEKSYRLLNIF